MWQWFNFASAMLGLFSLFLYAFIYTPLKKVNSISVIGWRFSGRLPCLIGWVAATGLLIHLHISGTLSTGSSTFFNYGGIFYLPFSFFGSFRIFGLLPGLRIKIMKKRDLNYCQVQAGPTKFTALQTVIYSMLMVPVGMLPYYFHISGILAFWILLACNLWMVFVSVLLVIKMNVACGKKSNVQLLFLSDDCFSCIII